MRKGDGTNSRARHHHILRVDNETTATHCWKIKIRRRGKVTYKYFTDGRHGGQAKALAAAKLFRDALMEKNSDSEYAVWRRNVMRPDNKSGVVGVGRYISRTKTRNGVVIEYPVWEAFWHDADSKRRRRKFYIHVHGERRAKQLACKAREDAMEEVRAELKRRGKLFGA